MRYFIDTYSWKGASLLLGGIVLNCVVCGSLLRPPPKKIVPKIQISIVTFPLRRNVINQIMKQMPKLATVNIVYLIEFNC